MSKMQARIGGKIVADPLASGNGFIVLVYMLESTFEAKYGCLNWRNSL